MDKLLLLFIIDVLLVIIIDKNAILAMPKALIKPYSTASAGDSAEEDQDLSNYHLAQVVPPAKYKVIIWDQLNKDEFHLQQSIFDLRRSKIEHWKFMFAYHPHNLEGVGEYFKHFYAIETDENGQFFMRKNKRIISKKWTSSPLMFNKQDKNYYSINLIPMKGTNLLLSASSRKSYLQEAYPRKMSSTIDSICNFSDTNNRCVIKYFESIQEWKSYTNYTLYPFAEVTHWFFGKTPDRIDVFLYASFLYVIEEAKNKCDQLNGKMDKDSAIILGTYLNALAEANKNGKLFLQLRIVDQRFVGLIDQFCQIRQSFLMEQDALMRQLNPTNGSLTFCHQWTEMLSVKFQQITQFDVVMEAFNEWIYGSATAAPTAATAYGQIEEGKKEIIKFWLKMFARWLNKYRNAGDKVEQWPELDLRLFHRIGELLVRAKRERKLTTGVIAQIPHGCNLLDTICFHIKNEGNNFIRENGQQSEFILTLWQADLCMLSNMMHFVTPIPLNNAAASSSTSTTTSQQPNEVAGGADESAASSSSSNNKCIICLADEREYAFLPCKHYCTCGDCALFIMNNTTPTCPICREPVTDTMRLYYS